jgi:hypothetical protein
MLRKLKLQIYIACLLNAHVFQIAKESEFYICIHKFADHHTYIDSGSITEQQKHMQVILLDS